MAGVSAYPPHTFGRHTLNAVGSSRIRRTAVSPPENEPNAVKGNTWLHAQSVAQFPPEALVVYGDIPLVLPSCGSCGNLCAFWSRLLLHERLQGIAGIRLAASKGGDIYEGLRDRLVVPVGASYSRAMNKCLF